MKNLFTWPNNSGTYYVNPDHIGDGTFGMSQRIDDVVDGTYNFHKSIDPVSDLSLTWQTATPLFSAYINYFDHYKEGDHLTVQDLYNNPLIELTTEQNIEDISSVTLNTKRFSDYYSALPGTPTHDEVVFTIGNPNHSFDMVNMGLYMLTPSQSDFGALQFTDGYFTAGYQSWLSTFWNVATHSGQDFTLKSRVVIDGESSNLRIKHYQLGESTSPILAANPGDNIVTFTDSTHTLQDNMPVTASGFDGDFSTINGDTFYVDVIDTSTFKVYTDQALTDPLKYIQYTDREYDRYGGLITNQTNIQFNLTSTSAFTTGDIFRINNESVHYLETDEVNSLASYWINDVDQGVWTASTFIKVVDSTTLELHSNEACTSPLTWTNTFSDRSTYQDHGYHIFPRYDRAVERAYTSGDIIDLDANTDTLTIYFGTDGPYTVKTGPNINILEPHGPNGFNHSHMQQTTNLNTIPSQQKNYVNLYQVVSFDNDGTNRKVIYDGGRWQIFNHPVTPSGNLSSEYRFVLNTDDPYPQDQSRIMNRFPPGTDGRKYGNSIKYANVELNGATVTPLMDDSNTVQLNGPNADNYITLDLDPTGSYSTADERTWYLQDGSKVTLTNSGYTYNGDILWEWPGGNGFVVQDPDTVGNGYTTDAQAILDQRNSKSLGSGNYYFSPYLTKFNPQHTYALYQFNEDESLLANPAYTTFTFQSGEVDYAAANTTGSFLEPTPETSVHGFDLGEYDTRYAITNNTTQPTDLEFRATDPEYRAASATILWPGNQNYNAISNTGDVTLGYKLPDFDTYNDAGAGNLDGRYWYPLYYDVGGQGPGTFPLLGDLISTGYANPDYNLTFNGDNNLLTFEVGDYKGRFAYPGGHLDLTDDRHYIVSLEPGDNNYPHTVYPIITSTPDAALGDPLRSYHDVLNNEVFDGHADLLNPVGGAAWYTTGEGLLGSSAKGSTDQPARVWPTHVKPMTVEVSTQANNFGSVSATNNISTVVPTNKTIMVTVEYPPLTKEQFKPFQAVWSMAGSGQVFRLPLADEIFGDMSQASSVDALRVVGTQTVNGVEYWKVQGLPADTTDAIKKGQVFYMGNNHTGGTVTVANNCDSNVYGEALVVFAEQEYDMPSKNTGTLIYANVPWVNASISQSPGFEYTINTDETVNLTVTFALDKHDTTAFQNQDTQ